MIQLCLKRWWPIVLTTCVKIIKGQANMALRASRSPHSVRQGSAHKRSSQLQTLKSPAPPLKVTDARQTSQDPMDFDKELGRRLYEVISRCCAKEFERLVQLQQPPSDHAGLRLDYWSIVNHDPDLADALLKNPRAWLSKVENLLTEEPGVLFEPQIAAVERLDPAFKAARDEARQADLPPPEHDKYTVKWRLHLRLLGLEGTDGFPLFVAVGDIGSAHMNKLVCMSGTVIRVGPVKMFKAIQKFECTRCKFQTNVRCKLEDGGVAPAPESCGNPHQICPGTKFRPLPEGQEYTGWQEIKIQAKSSCLTMGAVPSSLPVVLFDELVDRLQCGDDVEVLGVITPRWQPMFPGQRVEVELFLNANNFQIVSKKRGRQLELAPDAAAKFQAFWDAHTHNPLCARNKIIAGICPQIHGMFLVKLAMALTLIGGVPRPGEDGRNLRGDVHLLLIGDPGIGKSQIMKFAAQAAHRSVSTSGRATSAAGLTAAAIREGNGWSLEGGALVLADGGVLCIDEFDGIKEEAKTTMHEAMEQQTIHMAKAGIVATIPTRTTVVASVNPKPGWKPSQPLSAATNISGPLLSRFDIVLLLLDVRHEQRDKAVANKVLDNHQQGARRVQQGMAAAMGNQGIPGELGGGDAGATAAQGMPAPAHQRPNPSTGANGVLTGPITIPTQQLESVWPLDALRMYLVWVKQAWQPQLTDDAQKVLQAYYQMLRQNEDRNAARTTVRMLESLIRIAQAHARLCARERITRQDAVVAVLLADASQGVLRVVGQDAPLSSEFSADPDAEYQLVEQRVMRELGLSSLLALPATTGGAGGGPAAALGVPRAVADGGQGGWQALRTVLAPQQARAEWNQAGWETGEGAGLQERGGEEAGGQQGGEIVTRMNLDGTHHGSQGGGRRSGGGLDVQGSGVSRGRGEVESQGRHRQNPGDLIRSGTGSGYSGGVVGVTLPH